MNENNASGNGNAKDRIRELELMAQALVSLNEASLSYLISRGKRQLSANEIFLEMEGLFREALAIAREASDYVSEAELLYNLGRLYQDPPRSSLFLPEREPFSEAWCDKVDAFFDGRSGFAYQGRPANHKQAISYFKDSLVIARNHHRPVIEASCLVNMALAFRELGETRDHRQMIDEALSAAEMVPNPQLREQILAAIRNTEAPT